MPVSQTQAPEIGIITGLSGEAFAESASGIRHLEPGSPIYQGEELVTGENGNIEVRFSDDTLLSQGADSRIALDDYAYDPSNGSGSELFIDIAQGTFRVVTGKIAETNPEKFKVGSPLATIGIRGTITVHEVIPGNGEKHGVEEIHSGKALLIQSNITGEIRQIGQPMGLVDISLSGSLSPVRPLTMQEFNSFRDIAPANIRQEQEIESGREEKDQQDNEDHSEGQDDPQHDEQAADQGEGQGEDQDQQGSQAPEQPTEQQQEPQEELPQDVTPGGGEPDGEDNPGGVLFPEGGALNPDGKILSDQKELDGTKMNEPPKPDEKPEVEQDPEAVQQRLGDADSQDDAGQENEQDRIDDGKLDLEQQDQDGRQQEEQDRTEDGEVTEDDQQETGTSQGEEDDSDGDGDGSDNDNDLGDGDSGNAIVGVTGQSNVLTGTSDADEMIGQELADTLTGMEGDDKLTGNAGDDELYGKSGNDTLWGSSGEDMLNGGTGTNYLDGGSGDDGEIDFASYADATGGVSATLGGTGTGTATGDGFNDTLVNIEGLIGSDYADTLVGDDGDNRFEPLLSKEYNSDSPGDNIDYINGKGGNDWIQFETLSNKYSVAVDLADSSAQIIESTDFLRSQLDVVNIENVIGSSGDDIIIGDTGDNTLDGGKGDDYLEGSLGNDYLIGNAGNDSISGGIGNDSIEGNEGDDFIDAGEGNNSIDGGDGEDSLSYSEYSDPVELILTAAGEGTATHHTSSTDSFENVERFIGSSCNDSFTGSSGNDTFDGSGGNDYLKGEGGDDHLTGGTGDDTIDGGSGDDWVSYSYTSSSVIITLSEGTDGSAELSSEFDILRYIENAEGSTGADTIYGSSADNILMGLEGDDILKGGDGDDTLMGGEGSNKLLGEGGDDTASYADLTAASGVSIDIAGGTVAHSSGTDTLMDTFATFVGSQGSDIYTGTSSADTFFGADGDDTFIITLGTEYFDGESGTDTVSFENIEDAVSIDYSSGTASGTTPDGTFAVTGVEHFVGTDYNDSFIGSDADETFSGLGGEDTIDGGDGSDWVSYAYDTGYDGLVVDLSSGNEYGLMAGVETDRLISIENVIGTGGDDTLIGSDADNHLIGGDSEDWLDGGKGDDILEGGSSDNSIIGGDGCDTISFASTNIGLTINLGDGNGSVAHDGYTDTFSSIEAVIGSTGNDTITSSSGIAAECPDSPNDTIQGYGGNDTINLITGQKSLLIYSGLDEGGDTINNFTSGEDSFLFKGEDFDSSAASNIAEISESYDGTNSGISSSDACFVFDDTSGQLWYDSNGSDTGGATLIATLNGTTEISTDDISVS